MANETFFSVIEGNETLTSRFESVVAHASEVVQARYGTALDKDAVASIPECRLSVLSGQPVDEDAILREVQNLQVVKDAMHKAAVDEALKAGEESALEEYKGLSPAAKINLARERGHTTQTPAKPARPGPVEEAAMLRKLSTISNRKTRLDLAREWGLVDMMHDTLDRDEVIAELKERGGDWRAFFKEGDSHHYYTLQQARVSPHFYLSIGQELGWYETPNPRHPK